MNSRDSDILQAVMETHGMDRCGPAQLLVLLLEHDVLHDRWIERVIRDLDGVRLPQDHADSIQEAFKVAGIRWGRRRLKALRQMYRKRRMPVGVRTVKIDGVSLKNVPSILAKETPPAVNELTAYLVGC